MAATSLFARGPTKLLRRKRFSEAEDQLLRDIVRSGEELNWSEIAIQLPGRTARQCRDRFKNYLSDDVTFQAWSPSEDEYVMDQYRMIGPRWSMISAHLAGRCAVHVKNRWYKHLSRRWPMLPSETPATEEPEKADEVEEFDWERTMTSACPRQPGMEWNL
jgi:hypothetical protein